MNYQCKIETVTDMLEGRPGVPTVQPASKIGVTLQRARAAWERGDAAGADGEIGTLLRANLLEVHPIISGRLRELMNGNGDARFSTP